MGAVFNAAWAESIRQTTTADFSMEQSSATLVGYLDADYVADNAILNEVVGDCVVDGTGGLTRTLPLAHPQYPWMFATNLKIAGVGFDQKVSSTAEYYEAPPIGSYAVYKKYQYQITFATRPYMLLADDSISRETLEYYDRNGDTFLEFNVPREYWRYTDYEELPAAEYLTAQQGQFSFERVDAEAPDGNTVPGQLRLLQKKSIVKFRWYQVPNHYLTSSNSYINAALGYVNQTSFNDWGPGTLLMLSCIPMKRYTPVNPSNDQWWTGAIGNAKLVDLEFTFLKFDPPALSAGEMPAAPTNPNHIVGGHNLLPWMASGGGRYFYAYGGPTGSQAPLYLSYPFQLMFKDPDAA